MRYALLKCLGLDELKPCNLEQAKSHLAIIPTPTAEQVARSCTEKHSAEANDCLENVEDRHLFAWEGDGSQVQLAV